MHKHRFTWVLAAALVLSGCSTLDKVSETGQKQEYTAVLPYGESDTRVKHVGIMSDVDTRIQIEDGLMDLSKPYFSPSKVKYKTHEFLDYDELDATDGSRGLLGTNRDENPNGLNPNKSDTFDTGNGTVEGATILVDIYELDWYSGDQLNGISLSLVVNSEVDGKRIKKGKMRDYLKVTSTKLVNYMRSRFNKISDNIPIYIAAYELNNDGDASMGGYIYSGYFQNNQQTFKNIKEEWYRVPSNDFTKADAKTAKEFTEFENVVSRSLSDTSYVIATAKYENGKLTRMDIEITAHGKTAGEIQMVSQVVEDELTSFTAAECKYTVKIIDNNKTYYMMNREPNSNGVNVVSSL